MEVPSIQRRHFNLRLLETFALASYQRCVKA